MPSQPAIMLYVAKHDLAYRYADSVSRKVPADAGFAVAGAVVGCFAGLFAMHKAVLSSRAGTTSVDLDIIEKMVEGRYLALARHLAKREHVPVQLQFSDVEQIIGEFLPVSARKHRAWWGNESSPFRVQASAWMGIGWKVAEVDLGSEWVRFERR